MPSSSKTCGSNAGSNVFMHVYVYSCNVNNEIERKLI